LGFHPIRQCLHADVVEGSGLQGIGVPPSSSMRDSLGRLVLKVNAEESPSCSEALGHSHDPPSLARATLDPTVSPMPDTTVTKLKSNRLCASFQPCPRQFLAPKRAQKSRRRYRVPRSRAKFPRSAAGYPLSKHHGEVVYHNLLPLTRSLPVGSSDRGGKDTLLTRSSR